MQAERNLAQIIEDRVSQGVGFNPNPNRVPREAENGLTLQIHLARLESSMLKEVDLGDERDLRQMYESATLNGLSGHLRFDTPQEVLSALAEYRKAKLPNEESNGDFKKPPSIKFFEPAELDWAPCNISYQRLMSPRC